MARPEPAKPIFEWSAIAFTGVCLVLLVALASTGYVGSSTEVTKTNRNIESKVSSVPAIGGTRFGGRIVSVVRKPLPVQYVAPPAQLKPLFDRIGYRLENVRRYGAVPRLFLASLPENLRDIREPKERKALFIKMALPLILHANEMILWDRKIVLSLLDEMRAGKTITASKQAWLDKKAEEYGLSEPDLAEMVRRIDIIPPSLALAQAAEESGWGTSRFAHQGNAIFGQRTWRGRKSMTPVRREKGETFGVRAFDSLIDGIMSYTRNLNGHEAYSDFRRVREHQRRRGGGLQGYDLATTLKRYSERGNAYIKNIRMLIRVNKLQAFDRVRLKDQRTVDLGYPDA